MYEIGHVNDKGDWDSAYGPYVTRVNAEDMLEHLKRNPIPGVTWEIRKKEKNQ